MKLEHFLNPQRIMYLQGVSKDDALSQLVGLLCSEKKDLNPAKILSRVWKREDLLTTRISDSIAIPHAKIPDIQHTRIAVGISHEGIDWDQDGKRQVKVIVLILGHGADHIQVLSTIAQVLNRKGIVESLLQAENETKIFEIVTRPQEHDKSPGGDEAVEISRSTFLHALSFALDTSARFLLLHPDSIGSLDFLSPDIDTSNVILITEDKTHYDLDKFQFHEAVQIPYRGLMRSNQVDMSILFLLSQGILEKGDKVINILGNYESGFLDSIILSDVEKEYKLFFSIRSGYRPGDLDQQVFARVIQIAHELAVEGREGKPVGTIFVLGDHKNVQQSSRQLLINPFKGYQEEERNVLDPSLEETIKEFSRIDGAFLIRGDGVILSAGTYLQSRKPISTDLSGLGARHTAAAGITSATGAISIVISESTKKVSIFSAGERVMVF
jgi:DNA integrity scanning protein DisA with diadenylate cyclase activity/mannitol/fructose-specific phosphotransferase system IIA component (Ntr-type)